MRVTTIWRANQTEANLTARRLAQETKRPANIFYCSASGLYAITAIAAGETTGSNLNHIATVCPSSPSEETPTKPIDALTHEDGSVSLINLDPKTVQAIRSALENQKYTLLDALDDNPYSAAFDSLKAELGRVCQAFNLLTEVEERS